MNIKNNRIRENYAIDNNYTILKYILFTLRVINKVFKKYKGVNELIISSLIEITLIIERGNFSFI